MVSWYLLQVEMENGGNRCNISLHIAKLKKKESAQIKINPKRDLFFVAV